MVNDPRTQPTSMKIQLTTGEGVDITWADSHHSHYSFDYLRQSCPCATCRSAHEKTAGTTALPLYKEKARALQAEPVGNYAVRFAFSDAHNTGIYSFNYLREICPCVECRALRGGVSP
ncbi:MAG: gamma-butyrobetaine hydroxylase-like domain-containing protein [Terriglobia bacterium]